MKNIYKLIVVLSLFFSCQNKHTKAVSGQKKLTIKKDTLELLFSNSIGDGRFHNQFSKISYSDSIFFISSPIGESLLYLNGKLILKKNILAYNDYDSIDKKYHLKKIDVLKFARPNLNYQFEENNSCKKLKSINSKILFHSVMKSKSGSIFQYIGYENEIQILKICNSQRSFVFHIKNDESDLSYIKLIDITGDGKEELFIFNNDYSYPALCFNVYQINYLE